jgi:hypothetical protein
MRPVTLVTAGIAIGLAAGAVLPAAAGYTSFADWIGMSSTERLGYVAGVADTLEAIHQLILAQGPQNAANAVRIADTCTDPLKLGEVIRIAEDAAAAYRDSVPTPAAALVLALVRCAGSTPAPSPLPAPLPTPSQ